MASKVSVIIPAYQSGNYLEATLSSVFSQSFKDFEVIVVDDGSTDHTHAILDRFQGEIVIIRQKNQGPSAARNNAVKVSKGEYLAFVDADDLWLPEKLAKQMVLLERDPAIDLVFSDCYLFSEKGECKRTSFQISPPFQGFVFERLFAGNFITMLTVVIRKDCYLRSGGLDTELKFGEDYDLWLRISRDARFAYVNEPLAKYRIHPNQLSSQDDRMVLGLIKIKERILSESNCSISPSVLEQGYYSLYLKYAKILLSRGEVHHAKTYLLNYQRQSRITVKWAILFLLAIAPVKISRLIIGFWNRQRTGICPEIV